MSYLVKNAVALLSSGLDSSLALNAAIRQGITVELALTFNYGQRAANAEIEHSKAITEHFSIPHQVVELPWVKQFTSGLTQSEGKVPSPNPQDLDDLKASQASAKAVWVPNRNGLLIEVAAGFAESLGCEGVIVGFNKEEAATFPDNSVEYLEAITNALTYSTANRVQVISPTARMDKRDIVKSAVEWKFPLSLIWSCYYNDQTMCGECESCQRLKRALNHHGVLSDVDFKN